MSVILYDDVGVLGLDGLGQLSEHGGLSDTCHVFEADFLGTCLNQLVGNVAIVFYGMHRRSGDTECSLRCHSCLKRPLDTRDNVAHIVESAEDTGDIHALCVLHLVLQLAHIIGHWIHTQRIQTSVEHVGLDAHLIEGLAERPHCIVGVFACQQVNLFECAAIGFHTRETTHVDDGRSNTLQLVLAWLELT